MSEPKDPLRETLDLIAEFKARGGESGRVSGLLDFDLEPVARLLANRLARTDAMERELRVSRMVIAALLRRLGGEAVIEEREFSSPGGVLNCFTDRPGEIRFTYAPATGRTGEGPEAPH
jgi:hypothetical protein